MMKREELLPSGLQITNLFLTDAEADALLTEIDNQEWSSDLIRRTQQYGYYYDYRRRRVESRAKPFPPQIQALAAKLDPLPNQCIVNEYTKGQSIAAHVDSLEFGDVIVSISLCAPATMRFTKRKDDAPKVLDVILKPNSMVRMSGEARREWQHEIVSLRASRRVSITFRTFS